MRRSTQLVVVASAVALLGAVLTKGVIAEQPGAGPRPTMMTPLGEKGLYAALAPAVDELIVGFRADAGERARARTHLAVGARVLDRVRGERLVLVRLAAGADPAAAMRRYQASGLVARVEPNLPRVPLETVPTDPLFDELWGMRNTAQLHSIADPPPPAVSGSADSDIDASDAWDVTTGAASTVIAVLDSGADLSHPDLAPSLWQNPGEIPGNGIDDDGNGFVDDVNGWDFVQDDNLPQDEDDHGSHVSGIAGAAMNNDFGVVGVCPGCRIMVLRFDLDVFSEIEAIDYAIENGAQVLNGSFGGSGFSLFERRAFQRAENAGILSVIAAGNDAANQDMFLVIDGIVVAPTYPNAYDLVGIVSVAASNDRDEYGYFTGCLIDTGNLDRCAFSNFGHDSVDLAAPGVDILSTVPGGFAVFDGTSMAAPHVSGVAGLVRSLHPEYSVLQLRNALLNSVDEPASLGGGFTRTDGRLNAAAALNASTATTQPKSVGNIANATSIRGSRSGSLSFPSNVNDVYKRRLQRGEQYAVLLEVPAGKDFDLFVWKPGTLQIFQLDVDCLSGSRCRNLQGASLRGNGKDELIVFRAKRTGTYFLQVSSFFSSGSYNLEISRV